MYIILLKTPIEGKMQVEAEEFIAEGVGISLCGVQEYTYSDIAPEFILLSNIDSIIVKPE